MMENVLNLNLTFQVINNLEIPFKKEISLPDGFAKNNLIPSDKDNTFVQKALHGDLNAIEHIYEDNYRNVFRIVYRMYPVREIAEEIVNDTFITAFKRLETLKDHNAFRSWLFSIAVNNVRNRRRSEKKRITIEMDETYPAQNTGNPIMKAALEQAIDDLPQRYREIFLLHDADGFTHQEISRILNIAEGTSKSQLFKARNILKKILLEKKGINGGKR
jgi:RNA polymerase sigma-70 factor (ECF subfamily)